jgi:hypothetical protein
MLLHESARGKMISEWAKKPECKDAVFAASYSPVAIGIPEVRYSRLIKVADIVSSAVRGRMMSGIQARDTKPEILVRKCTARARVQVQTSPQGLAGQARYRLAKIQSRHPGPWMLLAHAQVPQTCAHYSDPNRVLAILERSVIREDPCPNGVGSTPNLPVGFPARPFEIPM